MSLYKNKVEGLAFEKHKDAAIVFPANGQLRNRLVVVE